MWIFSSCPQTTVTLHRNISMPSSTLLGGLILDRAGRVNNFPATWGWVFKRVKEIWEARAATLWASWQFYSVRVWKSGRKVQETELNPKITQKTPLEERIKERGGQDLSGWSFNRDAICTRPVLSWRQGDEEEEVTNCKMETVSKQENQKWRKPERERDKLRMERGGWKEKGGMTREGGGATSHWVTLRRKHLIY